MELAPEGERKRHIALVETAVESQAEDVAAVRALAGVAGCAQCAEVARFRAEILSYAAAAEVVAVRFAELERAMLATQYELRPIRKGMLALTRSMKHALLVHARCAGCGVQVGAAHVATRLRREPNGQELVCDACHAWLKTAGVSAASGRHERWSLD